MSDAQTKEYNLFWVIWERLHKGRWPTEL